MKQATARDIRNPSWRVGDVHGQYSYSNPHADLYRYINQWSDMESYLNVGYTGPGQFHMHVSNHHRLINRLAEALLALHAAGPHAAERRLLDVGSGRGGAAIYAFQRYGLNVVGIDFTRYNIQRANQNAREKGAWPQVKFAFGDAHNLPLADASFALAWSIESPAHFADKPAFLREVYRVLKPGGAFTFCDLLLVDQVAAASAETRQIYEQFLQTWDVPYLETFDGYEQAINDAGFEINRVEIVTRYNLDIYRRYCSIFLWLSHWRWLYHVYARYLKKHNGANLDNVYQHVLRSYAALRLGMIDYGLFWAMRR
jgi:ubiquinone/menaquinone biosynthesis C-methylase UbiE